MKKLSEKDFTFMQIVYAIWQLLSYYESYFCYTAPVTPMETEIELLYRAGTPFIQVTVPRVHCTKIPPDATQMREVLQQYLDYVILPETDIKPYAGGTTIYDIIEPLRIDCITVMPEEILIHFVYICDPLSFRYYQSIQQPPKI